MQDAIRSIYLSTGLAGVTSPWLATLAFAAPWIAACPLVALAIAWTEPNQPRRSIWQWSLNILLAMVLFGLIFLYLGLVGIVRGEHAMRDNNWFTTYFLVLFFIGLLPALLILWRSARNR